MHRFSRECSKFVKQNLCVIVIIQSSQHKVTKSEEACLVAECKCQGSIQSSDLEAFRRSTSGPLMTYKRRTIEFGVHEQAASSPLQPCFMVWQAGVTGVVGILNHEQIPRPQV